MPTPSPMRTVLLTLDRTEKDSRAIGAAEMFAVFLDADIHVLHVLGGVPGVDPADVSPTATRRHEEARAWLDNTQRSVRPAPGRKVTADLVVSIQALEQVLLAAETLDAAVVVMATRAAGTIGRALLGSVADQVVRQSPRPVVLVPPGADVRTDTAASRKALVALDKLSDGTRTIDELRRLAGNRLSILLFHVARPELADSYALRAAFPGEGAGKAADEVSTSTPQSHLAHAELEALAEGIRAGGGVAEVRVFEGSRPDHEIVRAAATYGVAFIAMATRRLEGMSRWLIGSVADGVTRQSSVPVLIVPPR